MSTTKSQPYSLRTFGTYLHGECQQGVQVPLSLESTSRSVISGAANSVTYGDNHRDWKDRIKKGQNATTDLSGTRYRIRRFKQADLLTASRCHAGLTVCTPLIGIARAGYGFVGDCTNVTFNGSNPNTISLVEANNQALMSLYKQIEKVNSLFQSGVFLGELGETLRMIRNPAKTLFEGVLSYSSSVKKRAKRLKQPRRRKFVSESYLEAVFGWLPLLSDIKSGAEALAEISLRDQLYHKYVVGQSNYGQPIIGQISNPAYGGSTLLTSSTQIAVNRRNTSQSEAYVKYYGKMRVDPVQSLYMATDLLGFNWRSFVPTAWELVPYSFLIDYFSNIGDVIHAHSTQITNLEWCSKTTRQAFVTTGYVRVDPSWKSVQETQKCSGLVFVKEVGGMLELESSRVVRTANAYSQVSVPSLRFKIPNLGSMKWLNIAALARVKMSKPLW